MERALRPEIPPIADPHSPPQQLEFRRLKPSGWWYVLACLPFAYVIQVLFLLFLSREGGTMADAAFWIDVAILLRSLIGLIWQPRHRDWRIYLAALFACIPLIWSLCFLWALASRAGFL